jgi:hypothetical protein
MFDVILRELHGKLERHNHGGSVPVAPEKQLLECFNCHLLRLKSVHLWYIFFQQR